MPERRADLLIFALLTTSAVLTVWLGVWGPVVADTEARGSYAVVKDFQPLIAASIALLAAWVAFRNTTRTIKHNQNLEDRRRSSKSNALRSVLPLSLSSISEHIAGDLAELVRLRINYSDDKALHHRKASSVAFSTLPPEIIPPVLDLLEYLDDDRGRHFRRMIQQMQIFKSRLSGLENAIERNPGSVTPTHLIESYMIDAACIIASTSAAFPFARFQDESIANVGWEEVRSAFMNSNFLLLEVPTLEKTIEIREKSGIGPFALDR